MKLAIMQPYFMPYIGYFQLINAADKFVIYDEIEYTKKGWINRNRILNSKGEVVYISLPLKKDSDFLSVNQRYLSNEWQKKMRNKMLNNIHSTYRKAPYFENTFSLIKDIIEYENNNLFDFIYHSLNRIKCHLGIKTQFVISSELPCNSDLKKEHRVLDICMAVGASHYINPIGGTSLYDEGDFKSKGVHLNFLKTRELNYPQFSKQHVPYLSIIDVLMFNSLEQVNLLLQEYDLL